MSIIDRLPEMRIAAISAEDTKRHPRYYLRVRTSVLCRGPYRKLLTKSKL
ncbi:hypothetical protein [Okeania sp. SIO2B3]|nr:hypothetical protein [Okeania sp. SIO2B3]NET42487.1 hypothetical protein [Okeania sp. SIO2B3]